MGKLPMQRWGKATAGRRGPKAGSLRGCAGDGKVPMCLGCCLVKGRTNEVGEVGWGQTMKGSECQLKLHSKNNGKPSKISKWGEVPSEMVCDGSRMSKCRKTR